MEGEEFADFSPEHVVHHDARNRDQQSDRRRFQRQAEPDHDGIDGHSAGGAHRMEGEHDAQHGAEQADIGGVRGDRADDDQAFGQRHFQSQAAGVLGKIDAAVKEPSLDRHGHGPEAERQEEPDDAVIDDVL